MANRASKRTKRKSDSIQEIVQTKHKKSHKPTTVITSGNLQFNVEVIQMASWRAFYLKLPEECFIFYEFCKSLNELTPLGAPVDFNTFCHFFLNRCICKFIGSKIGWPFRTICSRRDLTRRTGRFTPLLSLFS